MTAEGNKAVVRRLFGEVINRVPWGAPGQAPGLKGFKQVNTMLRAAFPDLRLTVEEMVAEGTGSRFVSRRAAPTRASSGAYRRPAAGWRGR